MKRLLAMLFVCSVAGAQTYYPYSTVPPTISSYTILCNNTAAVAAPIQCAFSGGTSTGNMALTTGSSYDPTAGTLPSTNVFNTAFGVGVLTALTNVSGTQGNTAYGYNALISGTTISQEDAFGKYALRDDTAGSFNSAFGSAAMRCFTGTGVKTGSVAFGHGALGGDDTLCGNTIGGSPGTYAGVVAIGAWSLQELTTGNSNTAVGESSMLNLSTGINNTSVGFFAGPCADTVTDTSGRACAGATDNVAVGYQALELFQGNFATAIGFSALSALTTGQFNTAVGSQALANENTASGNTAVGFDALLTQNGGSGLNTAVGSNAGKLSTGTQNTFVGANAGATQVAVNSNTGIGDAALTAATAGNNTAVGDHAGSAITSGTKNTVIGNQVASTTLQSGAGNIIIGVDSSADTASNSTGNTLLVKGTGTAAIIGTGLNGTPEVAISGTTSADTATAGYVGEIASVHCVVGTAAAAATTVTITNATPAVITWTSHTFTTSSGLANYTCPINFTTSGSLPTGLTVGTNYFIAGSTVSGDNFSVSDTAAHALAGTNLVATSSGGSGTQSAYIGNLATTNNVFNGAAMQLVAGDWDCAGLGEYQELTTLTTSRFAQGIATAGGAFGAIGTFTDNRTVSGAVGAFNEYQAAPTVQQNISGTTSEFLITSATFTVGTMNQGAFLRCRRMR
jgi:trimeric autotransporter adhesin